MLSRRYLGEVAIYIAQLLEGNYFTNVVRGRITTNLRQEVRECVYTLMYPKEPVHSDTTESIAEGDSHSSTSDKEV